MYEIEKKFILTDAQKKKLVKGAEFLGEMVFTDVYYDTKECALTKNDIWLRCRGGQWELKLPMQKNGKGKTNQYNEIEGEEKIRQIFDVAPEKSFLEDIQAFGYEPFCEIKTIRKKYKKGKFNIDLSDTEAEGFKYAVSEIEIMIEDKKDAEKASAEIFEFAKSLGLEIEDVRGKVIEYLKQKRPDHYQALVEAGVVVE